MEFLLGIILLALAIYAIFNVLQSSASTGAKVLWSLGIIFFPLIGFIVWFFAGPRGRGPVTV